MQQELIDLLEEEKAALMTKRDVALSAGKEYEFVEFMNQAIGLELAIDIIRGLNLNWGVENGTDDYK